MLEVNLTGEIRHHYDEESSLPAHNLVIKPLLEQSKSAYIFGLKKDDELFKANSDILISERGKFRFDSSKECVIGHEQLWNATMWKRGSIIILLQGDEFDFSDIFKSTYRPALTLTPNMGNTVSATKRCKEERELGNIAICFPASNGIEWMTIYANDKALEEIMKQAENNCREKAYYTRKE
ncbi:MULTISPECIES: hypothetical protein [Chryseobacterium]|uniref:Uncharacterized protein n=1 Tax=Chryseobacterium rhizosphaerae TaxID=395937 RepID=A0AAE3YAA9_9FLAO|nr:MULTISPECIES: hypothetical protein [Chryseobacterium]MBL3547585.1 hypothetical protein [Chryseobacterium sp. KMC2]MDC8099188.1 hypothetical protein [Chryseobacterium rhizosphaerae]MDR6527904.1 hypothetical protein [Chryseobacterium rhizosphaerae]